MLPKVLDENQLRRYFEDGFLVLRSFFPMDLINTARNEADALLSSPDIIHSDNIRCRWQSHITTGEPILDTLDPITDLSPSIYQIAKSQEMLAVLATLYGEPAFLFKDKLIYKPPGALGHAPHQDFIAWTGFPKSFTTVLVAIDEANEANGCLNLYRGYHTKGGLSPSDGDYYDLPESIFDKSTRVQLNLKPGDIAVFGAFLPHGSSLNQSNRFRRHLYLSYNALSDGGDIRNLHYEQFHAWIRKRYGEYGYMKHFFK